MKCQICGSEATTRWHDRVFCDKCLIKVLVNTVERFTEWSPADATELVAEVLSEHTDQAASLRRIAKEAV